MKADATKEEGGLVRVLCDALLRPDVPWADEVLDFLWYLQDRFRSPPPPGKGSAVARPGKADEEKKARPVPPLPAGGAGTTDWQSGSDTPSRGEDDRVPLHGVSHPTEGHGDAIPGSTVRSPAGHPLPERLLMARALKPLRRWVARRREEGMDEEATAERMAESRGIPCVVPRLVPERTLELCLIVERSPTMDVWGRTVEDFQRLILRSDVFRTVTRYELRGGEVPEGALRLVRAGSQRAANLWAPGAAAAGRLICLFTDGLSWFWRDGRLPAALAGWGHRHLTTVFQMLPPVMWTGTALRDLAIAHVRARRPGRPEWESSPAKPTSRLSRPPILLAAFSASYVHAWARTLGGCAQNRMTGLVLTAPSSASPPQRAAGSRPERAAPSLPDPAVALATFRACASPLAWRLAGLLSAVPLYLPVMRLVQQTMLPESTREHLAEVLLGGLVWRPPDENADHTSPEETLYDFVGLPDSPRHGRTGRGVREMLLDEQWIADLRGVLERVLSQHVESRFGRQGLDFKAILADPTRLGALQRISDPLRPFARVGAEVLRRLGGEYAVMAERLDRATKDPGGLLPPARAARYALLLGRKNDPSSGLDALERALSHPEVGNFLSVKRAWLDEQAEVERELERLFDGRVDGDVVVLGLAGMPEFWPTPEKVADARSRGGRGHLVMLGESFNGEGWTGRRAPGIKAFDLELQIVGEAGAKDRGGFLAALAEVLEKGLADRQGCGVVRFRDLYEFLSPKDLAKVFGRPVEVITLGLSGGASDTILARNHRYRSILDLGLEFLRIPAGRFTMGSPATGTEKETGRQDSEIQHEVWLTDDFFLGVTAVTQSAWSALMEVGDSPIANPSFFKGDSRRPVDSVTWDQAKEFCRRLTEREHQAGRLPACMVFTLPTESEWEYACRAGTDTPFAVGDGRNLSADQANFDGRYPYGQRLPKGKYRDQTTPVKFFDPNPWGLYDMHGNVYEWCEDWYGDYPRDEVTNPLGPASGTSRVKRGGCWYSDGTACRSAYRYWWNPADQPSFTGFRVAAVQASSRQRTRAMEAPRGEGGAEAGKGPGELSFRNMAKIQPGSFLMGSLLEEEGRSLDEVQHHVTLTRPFRLARYPVTQGQYEAVMGKNPSYFQNAGSEAPVEQVSYENALEFCWQLTKRHRRTGELPRGMIYTLPTEAQWEYACRAGSQGAIYTDEPWKIVGRNNAPALDAIAWYGGNSGVEYEGGYDSSGWTEKQFDHRTAGTHPVGQKQPNAWGLHDMLGNVWEWCWDSYADYSYLVLIIPGPKLIDPVGPAVGVRRVVRGGNWKSDAKSCRVAARRRSDPELEGIEVGFRVAAVQADERSERSGRGPRVASRARSPDSATPLVSFLQSVLGGSKAPALFPRSNPPRD